MKEECEKVKEELKEEREKSEKAKTEMEDLRRKMEESPAQSEAPASSDNDDKIKVCMTWSSNINTLLVVNSSIDYYTCMHCSIVGARVDVEADARKEQQVG